MHPKYYLSQTACRGMLRRADERGKALPPGLREALELQCGLPSGDANDRQDSDLNGCVAFACNQRDEVRDLGDASACLNAQPGMKQQTFVAAAFNGGAGAKAGGIGYMEDCSPVLKSADSGSNRVPVVLCLNDQGGERMDCTENLTGTLRRSTKGHEPIVVSPQVYEHNPQAGRVTGPHDAAPTVASKYGTGGNNLPLVGCELFAQNRTDRYLPSEVASTQASRQYKDATDLVVTGIDCRNLAENGGVHGTLQAKNNGGYSLNYLHAIRLGRLIRRLTPLECERLMGFPDGWTDLPGAADSARYRALGNSVAIPCVEYIMMGIGRVLHAA